MIPLCHIQRIELLSRLLLASCSVRVAVVLVDVLAHIKAPVSHGVLSTLFANGIRTLLPGHEGLAVRAIQCQLHGCDM